MAENKKMWANRIKKIRQKHDMNRVDFAFECLGIENIKNYIALEEARTAPTAFLKAKLEHL